MFDQLLQIAQSHPQENRPLTMQGEQILLIQKPADIFAVMRAPSHVLEKDLQWMRQILGPSRFTENGLAWQARRALSDTFFKEFSAPALAAATKARVARMIFEAGRNPPAPCHSALYQLLLDVFLEVQFGVEQDQLPLIDARAIMLLSDTASRNTFVSNHYFKTIEPDARAAQLRAFKAAREQALDALRRLRQGHAASQPIFARFTEAEARGEIENVDLEVLNLIVAGVDSSSSALHWMVLALASHPELAEGIRAEGGNAAARFVEGALTFLPATPLVARRALCDFSFADGRVLAPGHRVIANLLGVNGTDADTLIARIRDSVLAEDKLGRLLAFGAGERVCAGALFARQMLKAAVEGFAELSAPKIVSGPLGALDWRLSLSLKQLPSVAF
ncbi:cytochrome P450 [Xinfangfangia sp. CPCC 101601]|uniref:Cytochrome P450 n=1 Tax=Pseudogemmobacter lacusdianii TaxID=3069608 RepID=A0ABU0W2V1_9RHOB|nr:cytochrome P450 [Xinfangfangia sp. CPCC 101601]MDQ2067780.1 cytochrome P450 [Xinfangfangia sp. CPCC 101601]